MNDSEIDTLASITTSKCFDQGTEIVEEGDICDILYMIEEGTVSVSTTKLDSDQKVGKLRKGDFFCEKALISDYVNTDMYTAASRVKCLILVRQDFVRMLGGLKEIMRSSEEIRLANQRQKSARNAKAVLQKYNNFNYE